MVLFYHDTLLQETSISLSSSSSLDWDSIPQVVRWW